jgi:four helix bundle protein
MAVNEYQIISKSFTQLEVWKKMRLLKIKIEALTKTFPDEEKYRLTSQIIRSARGVNASIAEGHGRFTFPDRIHFCIIARGSLSETYNHLIDAYDCTYITREKLIELKSELTEVEKILNGFIKYLKQQLNKK